MPFQWFGERVEAQLRAATVRGVQEAGQYAVDELRRVVSEPYPPASQPGQPPHLRTGVLKASIEADVSEASLTATISVNVPYGIYLEEGTRNMSPRPFFAPTLERIAPRLGAIMAGAERYHGGGSGAGGGGFFSRLGRSVGGAISRLRRR